MDPSFVGYLSYRWHRICNPFSFEQLDRVLAFTDLQAGDRAADLGCGNAVVAAWMTERLGLDMAAVERFPDVVALARNTAAKPLTRGRITVVEGAAQDYLAAAGPHRLLSVMGAVNLLPGVQGPAATMAGLAPYIAPGGWLLWADPFWIKPPGPRVAAVFPLAGYETLPGWMAAGEQAGLSPRFAAVSTDADWEEYVWRMNASLEAWIEENPADPAAAAVRMRAALLRGLYLEEGRDCMGFSLYLFRKPV